VPDDANIDAESGGLRVYFDHAPSVQQTFKEFNGVMFSPDERAAMLAKLESGRKLIVPYKRNRMVFFPSNLYHRTDEFRFRRGHKNNRINVTMLWGRRESLRATKPLVS
jgi:hypothetical protein